MAALRVALLAVVCLACGSAPGAPTESACLFTVSPAQIDATDAGGSFPVSVTVTQGASCAWSAQSHSAFVTVGATGGTGSGTVTVTVAPNQDVLRFGSLTVAGQPIVVFQGPPTGMVRESIAGTISAVSSPACSETFIRSVDRGYYEGGTRRCVEIARRTASGGQVTVTLRWEDTRLDLDLVLNDGNGTNFRQSIAANRHPENVQFVLQPGTNVVAIAYLRGVDAQFRANGGVFTGEVATTFTLDIERPR